MDRQSCDADRSCRSLVDGLRPTHPSPLGCPVHHPPYRRCQEDSFDHDFNPASRCVTRETCDVNGTILVPYFPVFTTTLSPTFPPTGSPTNDPNGTLGNAIATPTPPPTASPATPSPTATPSVSPTTSPTPRAAPAAVTREGDVSLGAMLGAVAGAFILGTIFGLLAAVFCLDLGGPRDPGPSQGDLAMMPGGPPLMTPMPDVRQPRHHFDPTPYVFHSAMPPPHARCGTLHVVPMLIGCRLVLTIRCYARFVPSGVCVCAAAGWRVPRAAARWRQRDLRTGHAAQSDVRPPPQRPARERHGQHHVLATVATVVKLRDSGSG